MDRKLLDSESFSFEHQFPTEYQLGPFHSGVRQGDDGITNENTPFNSLPCAIVGKYPNTVDGIEKTNGFETDKRVYTNTISENIYLNGSKNANTEFQIDYPYGNVLRHVPSNRLNAEPSTEMYKCVQREGTESYGSQEQNFIASISDNSQTCMSPTAVDLAKSNGSLQHSAYWKPVYPFSSISQIALVRPLYTKKDALTQCRAESSVDVEKTDESVDLGQYFDTSAINIPLITDRMLAKRKGGNKRKQSFDYVRGSTIKIEIQRNLDDLIGSYQPTDLEDLYPENELPELDDIFKRKKRPVSTSMGIKRVHQKSQSVSPGSIKKINLDLNENSILKVPSNSFEEKISIAKISESDSESTDNSSDKFQKLRLTQFRKCYKCQKLFKSSSTLAVHVKHCKSLSPIRRKANVGNDLSNTYAQSIGVGCSSGTRKHGRFEQMEENMEVKKFRPHTRSQTKRSI